MYGRGKRDRRSIDVRTNLPLCYGLSTLGDHSGKSWQTLVEAVPSLAPRADWTPWNQHSGRLSQSLWRYPSHRSPLRRHCRRHPASAGTSAQPIPASSRNAKTAPSLGIARDSWPSTPQDFPSCAQNQQRPLALHHLCPSPVDICNPCGRRAIRLDNATESPHIIIKYFASCHSFKSCDHEPAKLC